MARRAIAIAALLAIAYAAQGAAKVYDVRAYGAAGDGVANDTKAIQRALDECAKTGGRVLLPPGTYLSGTIFLGDSTDLHIEKGATLLGSPDLADYNGLDAYPQNFCSRAEGWSAAHLVVAVGRHDVSVSGRGTIDGNGKSYFAEVPTFRNRVTWRHGHMNAKGEKSQMLRPGQELVFVECRRVSVRDVTLRDMCCWACFFHGCDDVSVGGVTVRSDIRYLNTDGIDIDSCRRVRVGDCDIVTGDDAITVRGSPYRLSDRDRVCEDVEVSNIVCTVSASAVRVGVGNGTIRNVRISGFTVNGSGRGIHVQSSYGRHGRPDKNGVDISNVLIERFSIRNTCLPVHIESGEHAFGSRIRDVRIKDVVASAYYSVSVIGSERTRPDGISFENCSFTLSRPSDGMPLPEFENPAAFRICRAGAVRFTGCSLRWDADSEPGFSKAFSVVDSAFPSVDASSSLHDRATMEKGAAGGPGGT